MLDPLSILGAGVGVTGLIIQVADECIKGYKFFCEAVGMPKDYMYLRTRLVMEQQYFLNFSLEAGILYVEGELCATLHVNRSVLLAVLAEIKKFMEDYATANGRYETSESLNQVPVNWDDDAEPDADSELMNLICLPAKETDQPAPEERKRLARLRKFGKGIKQTGKNVRSIAVEPKRLVWAAVDKEKFEDMIAKLKELNSFLQTLLDQTQARRLQESMDQSYREILQVRNDVRSLRRLVKALRHDPPSRPSTEGGNALANSIAAEQAEDDKRRRYLACLVEIKIQYTELDKQLNQEEDKNTPEPKRLEPLDLSTFANMAPPVFTPNKNSRVDGRYSGHEVWIEWRTISGGRSAVLKIARRIQLLVELLRDEKPRGFRAPVCIGYVEDFGKEDGPEIGIVFQKPAQASAEHKLVTLHKLIKNMPKPSLSVRVGLSAALAESLLSFHAVNWLYKGFCGYNIVFFSRDEHHTDVLSPSVCGFEFARPAIMGSMTEKPDWNPFYDVYRHPLAQAARSDGKFKKSYDMYSLGIVLMEIACWQPIEDILDLGDLADMQEDPTSLVGIKENILSVHQDTEATKDSEGAFSPTIMKIAVEAGDVFADTVRACLSADEIEEGYDAEQGDTIQDETAVAVRIQRVMEDIAKEIKGLAKVLNR